MNQNETVENFAAIFSSWDVFFFKWELCCISWVECGTLRLFPHKWPDLLQSEIGCSLKHMTHFRFNMSTYKLFSMLEKVSRLLVYEVWWCQITTKLSVSSKRLCCPARSLKSEGRHDAYFVVIGGTTHCYNTVTERVLYQLIRWTKFIYKDFVNFYNIYEMKYLLIFANSYDNTFTSGYRMYMHIEIFNQILSLLNKEC